MNYLRVSQDLSEVQLQILKSGGMLDLGGSQSFDFHLFAPGMNMRFLHFYSALELVI
jgi:hypothetical protein